MPYKKYILEKSNVVEYIGLDIEMAIEYNKEIRPDVKWDGIKMPFNENEFDTLLMIEVLEHVPDPTITLKESHRVLKENGVLFFTVPFLWPFHEIPNDHYRYTPFSLKRIFEISGFDHTEIYATGGWHASLAQMLGLWVRRSNISKTKKEILSIFLKPIINYLIHKDIKPMFYHESQMVPGLYGIAKKY